MTNTPAMNRYSWYGKLPSAGDFLQRCFPDTLPRQWSHWFQVGLQQEEQRSGEHQFTKAPVWTNRCDDYPLYTHVHSGNFTGQLFTLLFDPACGARPGRHCLYQPMVE